MKMHHTIVRYGPEDDYAPPVPTGDTGVPLALGRPGDPHAIRTNALEVLENHGLVAPEAAGELFHLAAAVYAADTRILRSTGYDQWTRAVTLHLPVRVPDLWR